MLRGSHRLRVERNFFDVDNGFFERHGNDRRFQRNHFAALALSRRMNGSRAEICRQHPVERIRAAAALKMTQGYGARFFSVRFFDFLRHIFADPADALNF
jgi:choline dehydrogenase-like flavoprotein